MAEKKETKETKEKKEVKEVKEKKATEETKEKKAAKPEAERKGKETSKEKKTSEKAKKDAKDEVKEEVKEEAKEKASEEKELLTSTENNRRKKAERREAKAARKEANKVEEKKRRPNNALIAMLIFGVMIGMFAFIWGYNYYQKSESIEKYMEETGMTEVYKSFMVDDYTTAAVKADGNTVKVVLKVAEDAPEDAVKEYKGKDGEDNLKDIGAYFLTSMKPEVRGFSAEARVLAKQGDEKLGYVKMSYRDAKKYVKDAQKKAAEGGGESDTSKTEETEE